MNKFLTSNTGQMRLARTIVQAIIGFIIDNAAMLVAQTQFSAATQAIIVAGIIAILSPIMSELGLRTAEQLNEIPEEEEIKEAE